MNVLVSSAAGRFAYLGFSEAHTWLGCLQLQVFVTISQLKYATGNYYRVGESLKWTRRDIYSLILIAAIPTVLYDVRWEFILYGSHTLSVVVSWFLFRWSEWGQQQATENPFEGGTNDIPMASMSRTIAIDLRDMLNEKDLPTLIVPVNNIVL
ncbi:hypothetical protein W03_16310 [Nitrosomonas sp. PY1]|uniref:hypothetical protein n=1 Tax=Nitrosomonas sp. PY1 TaxID=1803906 RepID=UPI001FC8B340|nr:hypothetical protein [Nitrosomonas sp. PY1]GKS69627.1 hypothetical protein W03_16310 [Nitrosomonas sp. PY1]